ncbi:MAG: hypothetical protein ACKVS9_00870 [Phycisphaerae bacterium]
MSSQQTVDALIAAIDPSMIAAFLMRCGFRGVGAKEGEAKFFENTEGVLIVLPASPAIPSFGRKLRDILEAFVTDTMPLDDVIANVVKPGCDVFRHTIATIESKWGSLPLTRCQEAVHAFYDTLRFSAAGLSSSRPDYRGGISENAKLYASQCHIGQTELGSFTVKVYCPTNPSGMTSHEVDEPFGRQANRAVIENLKFLASPKALEPTEPLPPTLNRQVASAVMRLGDRDTLFAKSTVALSLSSRELVGGHQTAFNGEPPLQLTVELGPFVSQHAQSVRDRLKKALEYERELLRGYIVELRKDKPVDEGEQSHEIKIEAKSGTGAGTRVIRMRLLPELYRNALRWHDSNEQVDLDAVIDKRTPAWTVAQLFELKPTSRDQQQLLFDVQ